MKRSHGKKFHVSENQCTITGLVGTDQEMPEGLGKFLDWKVTGVD